MSDTQHSKWFLTSTRRPQANLRLFCFPYAGGASVIYRNWGSQLLPSIEVIPVELPGRGKRMAEPAFRRLPPLMEAFVPVLAEMLDTKFAFFGHSMGAMIAFELTRELRRRGLPLPAHLLVSGRRAPQVADDDKPFYDLPEAEFRVELLRLKGTPVEVVEHEELMKLLEPLLRADFEMVQTYQYTDGEPLSCPITAFGGTEDDEVPRETVLAWKEQTESRFSMHMVHGDHFFVRSATHQLLELINRELLATAM